MAEIKSVSVKAEAKKQSRPHSGTGYPYFDLDASIKVAEVIHEKGGGKAAPDQLAAWLNYASTRSGTYLTRLAAAKQFGLIQSSPDGFGITDRAQKILGPVLPDDVESAKVEAFLSVELFSKVYDQFRGKPLPPEMGLKNLFAQTYKIVPDRILQALRVFINSAEQAGFFQATGDQTRLIKPSMTAPQAGPEIVAKEQSADTPLPLKTHGGGGSGGEGPPGVHSAIIGLLRDLPPPGSVWQTKRKQRFLDAFKAAIDHIYPEEDAT